MTNTINACVDDTAYPINNAKLAIVDFDGVIADTEPLHAMSYVHLLNEYGISFDPHSFSRYIGHPARQILLRMQKDFHVAIDLDTAERKRSDIFLHEAIESNLQPNREIVLVLDSLNTLAIPMTIVSSQRGRVINALLGRWQMTTFFQSIHSGPDMGVSKKSIIEHVVDNFHAPARDVLVIEDSKEMLLFAKQRGMRTIGVLHSLNHLAPTDADAIIQIESKGGV